MVNSHGSWTSLFCLTRFLHSLACTFWLKANMNVRFFFGPVGAIHLELNWSSMLYDLVVGNFIWTTLTKESIRACIGSKSLGTCCFFLLPTWAVERVHLWNQLFIHLIQMDTLDEPLYCKICNFFAFWRNDALLLAGLLSILGPGHVQVERRRHHRRGGAFHVKRWEHAVPYIIWYTTHRIAWGFSAHIA